MKLLKHLLIWCAIILTIIAFNACNPQKKLHKAIDELNKHPIESAKYCADKYPIKDSIVKGDTITVTDTLWGIVTDTVTDVYNDTVFVTKFQDRVINKTRTIRDTIYRENTARIKELEQRYLNCEGKYQALFLKHEQAVKQAAEYKKERNKWQLYFWLLVAAIGGYTFLRIRKLIPF